MESYYLFQDGAAAGGRALSPLQRREMAKKMNDSIKKIIDEY